MKAKKQITVVMMALLAVTAVQASDDDNDHGRTAARVLSPVGVPSAMAGDVVTVGQEGFTGRYIDKMRSPESKKRHQEKREARKAAKKNSEKPSTARMRKHKDDADVADRDKYLDVYGYNNEASTCCKSKKTCTRSKSCHRQHHCEKHHTAGHCDQDKA